MAHSVLCSLKQARDQLGRSAVWLITCSASLAYLRVTLPWDMCQLVVQLKQASLIGGPMTTHPVGSGLSVYYFLFPRLLSLTNKYSFKPSQRGFEAA